MQRINEIFIILIDQATKRGCGEILTAEETTSCNNVDNVQCDKCTGDNCNFLGTKNHLCLDCSSIENAECISGTSNQLSSARCPATLYSDNPMCYTKVVSVKNKT